MKIAILSDSWFPLANGVVTTLATMIPALEARGHTVMVIHPGLFPTIPCPTYSEIRLAAFFGRRLARLLDGFRPEAVHLVIEGPVGLAGRYYCLKRGLPFTTSFTTKFPEHIKARFPIPTGPIYWLLRWFHGKAARTTVAGPSLKQDLEARGFKNLVYWGRGVDTDLFKPGPKAVMDYPRPISLNVGRVAAEKNIEAFLDLELPGTKVIIGDGPALPKLSRKYPDVRFLGRKTGQDLAQHMAAADLFVFPSITDTFGVVMIEAMACGLPVAAFPVIGPLDIVVHGRTGYLDNDLQTAAESALSMDTKHCREYAMKYTLEKCFEQFEAVLVRIR